VPAHRLQHVVAAHPVVPGENIADGIVPHVPHMQLPRGVGEHRQAIKLRPGGIFPGAERALLFPVLLGRALYRLGIVSILHGTLAAKPPIIIAALCRCTSNTLIRNSSPQSRCPMSTRRSSPAPAAEKPAPSPRAAPGRS